VVKKLGEIVRPVLRRAEMVPEAKVKPIGISERELCSKIEDHCFALAR